MKLRKISEDEYDDLEDSQEFGSPQELISILKCHRYIVDMQYIERYSFSFVLEQLDNIYGPRLVINSSWNTMDANQSSMPSQEQIQMVKSLAKSNRIIRQWWISNKHIFESNSISEDLEQFDEYDDLEDSQEFGSPQELVAILKCEVFISMAGQADKLSYQMRHRLGKIYGSAIFQKASSDVNETNDFVPSDEDIKLVDGFNESDEIINKWWTQNRKYLLDLIEFQKEYEELKDDSWPECFGDYC